MVNGHVSSAPDKINLCYERVEHDLDCEGISDVTWEKRLSSIAPTDRILTGKNNR